MYHVDGFSTSDHDGSCCHVLSDAISIHESIDCVCPVESMESRSPVTVFWISHESNEVSTHEEISDRTGHEAESSQDIVVTHVTISQEVSWPERTVCVCPVSTTGRGRVMILPGFAIRDQLTFATLPVEVETMTREFHDQIFSKPYVFGRVLTTQVSTSKESTKTPELQSEA